MRTRKGDREYGQVWHSNKACSCMAFGVKYRFVENGAMAETGFDADMKRMQDLFGTLKHEYDLYFAGVRKSPPSKERSDIERLVRFYSNGTLNRLSQQFLFNSFCSKFSLHCEQWNKWLKAKEEGLVADPRFLASTRQAKKELYELEKSSGGRPKETAEPAPNDSGSHKTPESPQGGQKPVRRLYEEFINARLELGLVPEWDYGAFEVHLKKQKEAILNKYAGKDVVFSVQNQDGKVSLKAKVIK